jgi:hypothetical protein
MTGPEVDVVGPADEAEDLDEQLIPEFGFEHGSMR